MTVDIIIRDTRESDIEQFNRVLNSVVSERLFLAVVTDIPLTSSVEFISKCLQHKYPNVVADAAGDIVGWCDIVAKEPDEYAHVGRMGMGVADGYRGAGLGRRLLTTALQRAKEYGFEKIELDVYHDNLRARALYTQVGFQVEGTRKRYRKIDGTYQDNVMMALFLDSA